MGESCSYNNSYISFLCWETLKITNFPRENYSVRSRSKNKLLNYSFFLLQNTCKHSAYDKSALIMSYWCEVKPILMCVSDSQLYYLLMKFMLIKDWNYNWNVINGFETNRIQKNGKNFLRKILFLATLTKYGFNKILVFIDFSMLFISINLRLLCILQPIFML